MRFIFTVLYTDYFDLLIFNLVQILSSPWKNNILHSFMVFEGSNEMYYDTRDALIMVEWCNFTVYLVFTSRVYLFLMLPNNLTDNVIHIIAFNLLTFHPQK